MEILTVYSTAWCGWCRRLIAALTDNGIAFRVIDIDANAAAAELVASMNNGNRIVPTVLFPDGSAAVNPSVDEVRDRLGVRTHR